MTSHSFRLTLRNRLVDIEATGHMARGEPDVGIQAGFEVDDLTITDAASGEILDWDLSAEEWDEIHIRCNAASWDSDFYECD